MFIRIIYTVHVLRQFACEIRRTLTIFIHVFLQWTGVDREAARGDRRRSEPTLLVRLRRLERVRRHSRAPARVHAPAPEETQKRQADRTNVSQYFVYFSSVPPLFNYSENFKDSVSVGEYLYMHARFTRQYFVYFSSTCSLIILKNINDNLSIGVPAWQVNRLQNQRDFWRKHE